MLENNLYDDGEKEGDGGSVSCLACNKLIFCEVSHKTENIIVLASFSKPIYQQLCTVVHDYTHCTKRQKLLKLSDSYD